MDSTLVTALQGPSPTVCWLVEMALPAGTARLTDAGEVVFGGQVFHGEHPTLGVLGSISGLKDGAANTTTRVDVVVLPRSAQAAARRLLPAPAGPASARTRSSPRGSVAGQVARAVAATWLQSDRIKGPTTAGSSRSGSFSCDMTPVSAIRDVYQRLGRANQRPGPRSWTRRVGLWMACLTRRRVDAPYAASAACGDRHPSR